MVVIKWSDAIKGPRVKVDGPECGGLYKEDHGYIIPWSGTDPDAKTNYFTYSKDNNDWIVLGYHYNEECNNWRGTVYSGQFCQHDLKEMRNTEETCSKYAGSAKFIRIPREGNPGIPVNSYKDQCRDHIIMNGMWDVFSFQTHAIKRRGEIFFYISLHFPWNT